MKIAIHGNQAKEEFAPYIKKLFSKLDQLKVKTIIYEPFKLLLEQNIGVSTNYDTYETYVDLKYKTDCILSIGGDGTLLETVALVKDSGIPILGINTGRLGFLASVAKEDIESSIDLLLQKKYTLDARNLLQLENPNNLFGDFNYALNELTILKKDSSAMITIHAYVDGDFMNSYWADGLIVSTPTGSSAYSLSCGGPIVIPNSDSFIITPIAPHNLNVRPVVISDKSVIKLKVEGRSKNYIVSLDSRMETIDASLELTIKRGNFKINLIKLEGQSFYNTIRNKLLWGIDRRNY